MNEQRSKSMSCYCRTTSWAITPESHCWILQNDIGLQTPKDVFFALVNRFKLGKRHIPSIYTTVCIISIRWHFHVISPLFFFFLKLYLPAHLFPYPPLPCFTFLYPLISLQLVILEHVWEVRRVRVCFVTLQAQTLQTRFTSCFYPFRSFLTLQLYWLDIPVLYLRRGPHEKLRATQCSRIQLQTLECSSHSLDKCKRQCAVQLPGYPNQLVQNVVADVIY